MDHLLDLIKIFNPDNYTCDDFTKIRTAVKSCNDVDKDVCVDFLHTKIIPIIFDRKSEDASREQALELGFSLLEHVTVLDLPKVEQEKIRIKLEENYVKNIGELLHISYENWHKLWIFVVKFCQTLLHDRVSLTNKLLRVVEMAFRNSNSLEHRIKGCDCWIEFIENCCLNMDYLCLPKQIKLCLTPLVAKFSPSPVLAKKRFDVFLFLLKKLQGKATLCLKEFLEFCFGPFGVESDTKMNRCKTVPEVCAASTVALMEIIGHCHGDEQCFPVKTFEKPIINDSNFPVFAKTLILSGFESFSVLKCWNQDPATHKMVIRCILHSLYRLILSSDSPVMYFDYVKTSLGNTSSETNSQEIILRDVIQVVLEDDLVVDVMKETIFNSVVKLSLSPRGNLNMGSVLKFLSSCFETDCLKYSKLVAGYFKQYSQWDDVEILCEIFVRCKLSGKLAPSVLVWAVPILHHFSNMMAFDAKWIKLYKSECNNNATKQKLLVEIGKLFLENPLLSTNVVTILKLIFSIEKSGIDFVVNFLKVIDAILTLPNLSEASLKNLQSILVGYFDPSSTVFKSEDNEQALLSLCTCLKKIMSHLKEYTILTQINSTLEKHSVKNLSKIRKHTVKFWQEMLLDAKGSSSDGVGKIIKSLERKEEKMVSNVRSAKILNMVNNSTPKSSPVNLRLFGKDIESSPLRIKGSLLNNSPRRIAEERRRKSKSLPWKEDSNSADYVKIDTEVSFDVKKLSEHQKEVFKKRREDIPALYQDLSQQSCDSSNTGDAGVRRSFKVPNILRRSSNNKEDKEKSVVILQSVSIKRHDEDMISVVNHPVEPQKTINSPSKRCIYMQPTEATPEPSSDVYLFPNEPNSGKESRKRRSRKGTSSPSKIKSKSEEMPLAISSREDIVPDSLKTPTEEKQKEPEFNISTASSPSKPHDLEKDENRNIQLVSSDEKKNESRNIEPASSEPPSDKTEEISVQAKKAKKHNRYIITGGDYVKRRRRKPNKFTPSKTSPIAHVTAESELESKKLALNSAKKILFEDEIEDIIESSPERSTTEISPPLFSQTSTCPTLNLILSPALDKLPDFDKIPSMIDCHSLMNSPEKDPDDSLPPTLTYKETEPIENCSHVISTESDDSIEQKNKEIDEKEPKAKKDDSIAEKDDSIAEKAKNEENASFQRGGRRRSVRQAARKEELSGKTNDSPKIKRAKGEIPEVTPNGHKSQSSPKSLIVPLKQTDLNSFLLFARPKDTNMSTSRSESAILKKPEDVEFSSSSNDSFHTTVSEVGEKISEDEGETKKKSSRKSEGKKDSDSEEGVESSSNDTSTKTVVEKKDSPQKNDTSAKTVVEKKDSHQKNDTSAKTVVEKKDSPKKSEGVRRSPRGKDLAAEDTKENTEAKQDSSSKSEEPQKDSEINVQDVHVTKRRKKDKPSTTEDLEVAATNSADLVEKSQNNAESPRRSPRNKNPEILTPEKLAGDDLPSSPVNSDTPSRTTELLSNTSDISPITTLPETPLEPIRTSLRSSKMLQMLNFQPSPAPKKAREAKERKRKKETTCEMENEERVEYLTFTREIPSPLVTPSSSILKRKDVGDGFTPPPAKKAKMVNFPDPAITEKKFFIDDVEEEISLTDMEEDDISFENPEKDDEKNRVSDFHEELAKVLNIDKNKLPDPEGELPKELGRLISVLDGGDEIMTQVVYNYVCNKVGSNRETLGKEIFKLCLKFMNEIVCTHL